MSNLLIISSSKSNYSTRRIVEEARAKGHEVTVLAPHDFYLHTSANTNGHDKIYVKSERKYQKEVDVIIPRIGRGLAYGEKVVRHWTTNLGRPSTASAEGLMSASDKWKATQLLSKGRVRVPRTTIMKTPEDFGFLINLCGGFPCVAKLLSGSQGKGVFIIESELAGSTTLSAFSHSKMIVLLQEYIESAKDDERKSDIRAYVVDNEVVAAYKRFSLAKDFRSNYSLSKSGEKITLTDEEKDMAVRAAQVVGLGVAGVDIVRDVNDDNKPYILEINGNASLQGIEAVTGANVALKIVEFAERLAGNSPKNEAELSKIPDSLKRYGGNPFLCATTARALKK